MTRREHIEHLAAEMGVEIVLESRRSYPDSPSGTAGYEGNAWTARAAAIKGTGRWVEVFGWDDEPGAYFIALHELGHHAHGHQDSAAAVRVATRSGILEAEAEAWAWALDNAIEPPTEAVLRDIREVYLGSYVHSYGLNTAGPTYDALTSRYGLAVAA